MKSDLKQKLLLRMFSSIEYMEEYVRHFINFIDTGLLALETYEQLPTKPVGHVDYSLVETDVRLWHKKVKPNFLLMKKNIQEAIVEARQGDYSGIDAAAGNFRGLSKDMDGIRESFMDFIDPAIKQNYFAEWKIVGTMGDNLAKTIGTRWREGSILNEKITGVIDEKELLGYLSPDEEP